MGTSHGMLFRQTLLPSHLHIHFTFVVLPHSSIGAKDFHKHISPELPDPLRMRQLMVWAVQHCCDSVIERKEEEPEDEDISNASRLEMICLTLKHLTQML